MKPTASIVLVVLLGAIGASGSQDAFETRCRGLRGRKLHLRGADQVKLVGGMRRSEDSTVSRKCFAEYSVPCTAFDRTDCLPHHVVRLGRVNDGDIYFGGVRFDSEDPKTGVQTLTFGPEEACNPEPHIFAVLADGHRKLPWGLAPVGQTLAAEFRRMNVTLVWSTGDAPRPEGMSVTVNILPHPPTDWGLSKKAMGAVHRDDEGSSPVFIFYPSIERVLGVPRDTTRVSDPDIPSAKWILGLARIIAHEILHVLLPGKAHDRVGIFASDLRVSVLLAQELKLEEETRVALLESLCASQPVPDKF